MKYVLNSLLLMMSSATVYAGGGTVPPLTVPEPGTYALLAIGALGMWIAHRRKK